MTEIPKAKLPSVVTREYFADKQATDDVSFWDNQALLPGYQSVVVDDEKHTATRMLYNFLTTQFNFKDEVVLDIGCGVGRLIPIFLEAQAKEVHAIDISLNMLKITRFKHPHPNVLVYQMDAKNMYGFSDNSFSTVVSVTTLCHMTDEDDLEQTISETVRVTAPEGKIILIEPTSFDLHTVYQHSRMAMRPYMQYKKLFIANYTTMEHQSRECFGPLDHQDSWRTVMVFNKMVKVDDIHT